MRYDRAVLVYSVTAVVGSHLLLSSYGLNARASSWSWPRRRVTTTTTTTPWMIHDDGRCCSHRPLTSFVHSSSNDDDNELQPIPNPKDDENVIKASSEDTSSNASSPDDPVQLVSNDDSPPPVVAVTTTSDNVVEESSTRTQQQQQQDDPPPPKRRRRKVAIIGAGWGGLSAAHTLAAAAAVRDEEELLEIMLIEASGRVGGLVRDGYTTLSGTRPIAEAGQHGFWSNYRNVYKLLSEMDGINLQTALTEYAEQGQYSPQGLEAIWPIYRDQPISLPTGLAQAAYTRFVNLPWTDLLSAWPLVLAFSDFDNSVEAWESYDNISFYDLCRTLGVTQRCYDEAFEPMILTGLFAPGTQCSAAAALGMAYFFVLQSQNAFDVQWCRGNIGQVIFDPWIKSLEKTGVVQVLCNSRVTGFQFHPQKNETELTTTKHISNIRCAVSHIVYTKSNKDGGNAVEVCKEVDDIIFAVGAKALNAFVRFCPELAILPDFQKFANLRGTSVLATRIYLDRQVHVPYSANACWGFDRGIGMTVFDISTIHGPQSPTLHNCPGSVLEVDYYHAGKLLVLSDSDIVAKVKADLDTILGRACSQAVVIDAAIIRLPEAVNWYFPGSYVDMPDHKSSSVSNIYFAGDIVRTRHGSWSQEKALVTGIQAANILLGRSINHGVLPVPADEVHVKLGRNIVTGFKSFMVDRGILPTTRRQSID